MVIDLADVSSDSIREYLVGEYSRRQGYLRLLIVIGKVKSKLF